MGVYELFPEEPNRVYLSLRILERPPVHIWREPDITLITCDPRATRLEVTEYVVRNCTSEEANQLRAGFGLPPLPESVPDWTTDEEPAFLYVPPVLRVPGAPAIQGGRELARRKRMGLLDREWLAWMNELRAEAARGA